MAVSPLAVAPGTQSTAPGRKTNGRQPAAGAEIRPRAGRGQASEDVGSKVRPNRNGGSAGRQQGCTWQGAAPRTRAIAAGRGMPPLPCLVRLFGNDASLSFPPLAFPPVSVMLYPWQHRSMQ